MKNKKDLIAMEKKLNELPVAKKQLIINLNKDIEEEQIQKIEECIQNMFDCFSSVERINC
jgi:hypothetical protein